MTEVIFTTLTAPPTSPPDRYHSLRRSSTCRVPHRSGAPRVDRHPLPRPPFTCLPDSYVAHTFSSLIGPSVGSKFRADVDEGSTWDPVCEVGGLDSKR